MAKLNSKVKMLSQRNHILLATVVLLPPPECRCIFVSLCIPSGWGGGEARRTALHSPKKLAAMSSPLPPATQCCTAIPSTIHHNTGVSLFLCVYQWLGCGVGAGRALMLFLLSTMRIVYTCRCNIYHLKRIQREIRNT